MLPGIPAEYLETKLEKIRRSVEFRNGESGLHVQNIRMFTEMLLERLLECLTDLQEELRSSLHKNRAV